MNSQSFPSNLFFASDFSFSVCYLPTSNSVISKPILTFAKSLFPIKPLVIFSICIIILSFRLNHRLRNRCLLEPGVQLHILQVHPCILFEVIELTQDFLSKGLLLQLKHNVFLLFRDVLLSLSSHLVNKHFVDEVLVVQNGLISDL